MAARTRTAARRPPRWATISQVNPWRDSFQARAKLFEMLTNLTQDFRFAARILWRNRGFAASAMLILALGIAASTGLFAVIDAVVLHPLPYFGADRIARVRLVTPSGQPQEAIVSADQFRALRTASTLTTSSLDGVYIHGIFTRTLGGTSFPESVWIEEFSGNAPSMLGV